MYFARAATGANSGIGWYNRLRRQNRDIWGYCFCAVVTRKMNDKCHSKLGALRSSYSNTSGRKLRGPLNGGFGRNGAVGPSRLRHCTRHSPPFNQILTSAYSRLLLAPRQSTSLYGNAPLPILQLNFHFGQFSCFNIPIRPPVSNCCLGRVARHDRQFRERIQPPRTTMIPRPTP